MATAGAAAPPPGYRGSHWTLGHRLLCTVAVAIAARHSQQHDVGDYPVTGCSCTAPGVEMYDFTFTSLWVDPPPPTAASTSLAVGWSYTYGVPHSPCHVMWRDGTRLQDQDPMRKFVLSGSIRGFPQAGSPSSGTNRPFHAEDLLRKSVLGAVTHTTTVWPVDKNHPLISAATVMLPSPDWFVGIDSLSLCNGSTWLSEISVPVYPYDGGLDNGPYFNSSFQPQGEEIAPLTPSSSRSESFRKKCGQTSAMGVYKFTRQSQDVSMSTDTPTAAFPCRVCPSATTSASSIPPVMTPPATAGRNPSSAVPLTATGTTSSTAAPGSNPSSAVPLTATGTTSSPAAPGSNASPAIGGGCPRPPRQWSPSWCDTVANCTAGLCCEHYCAMPCATLQCRQPCPFGQYRIYDRCPICICDPVDECISPNTTSSTGTHTSVMTTPAVPPHSSSTDEVTSPASSSAPSSPVSLTATASTVPVHGASSTQASSRTSLQPTSTVPSQNPSTATSATPSQSQTTTTSPPASLSQATSSSATPSANPSASPSATSPSSPTVTSTPSALPSSATAHGLSTGVPISTVTSSTGITASTFASLTPSPQPTPTPSAQPKNSSSSPIATVTTVHNAITSSGNVTSHLSSPTTPAHTGSGPTSAPRTLLSKGSVAAVVTVSTIIAVLGVAGLVVLARRLYRKSSTFKSLVSCFVRNAEERAISLESLVGTGDEHDSSIGTSGRMAFFDNPAFEGESDDDLEMDAETDI